MANSTEEKIRAYLMPVLLACFGTLSWNVIVEIRSDVKSLLKSNAETTIRVNELERRVGNIETVLSERLFAILPEEIKIKKKNEKAPHN